MKHRKGSGLTQQERVLAFLRSHPGCTKAEMTFGLQPLVANLNARISDLRDEGYQIECVRAEDGVERYRVVEQAAQLALAL